MSTGDTIAEALAIPGFAVQRLLGEGAFGRVWLARETEGLRRTVALKVFHAERLDAWRRELVASARVEDLRRDARELTIVQALGSGEHEGRGWLALEYVEQGSLKDLVERDGPLPLDRALAAVRDAGRAIERLHEAGIFHRDVKPANLLLGGDGRVRLGDFGLTRELEGSLSAAGSPAFAPPEQIAGCVREDERRRVDIYSLGATLSWLLTGVAARPGRPDAFELERRAVPRPIQRVVLRAMAYEPTERPATVSELLGDLAAAEATSAGVGKQTERAGRTSSGDGEELIQPEDSPMTKDPSAALIEVRCAACDEPVRSEDPKRACEDCMSWQHLDCRRKGGGCAVCKTDDGPVPLQSLAATIGADGPTTNRPRRAQWVLLIMALTMILGAALVQGRDWLREAEKKAKAARIEAEEREKAARIEAELQRIRDQLEVARALRRQARMTDSRAALQSARDLAVAALGRDGKSQQAAWLHALTLRELREPISARETAWKRTAGLDETSALGFFALARVSELEGREERAIKQDESALALEPLREGYIAVAELLRRRREHGKALACLQKWLATSPDDSEALALRAHVRMDLGDWDSARADIARAIELDKGQARLFGLRARLFLHDGNIDAAVADCERGIHLDQRGYLSYLMRGRIRLLHKTDKFGAASDLRLAVSLGSRIADAWYWRGRLLQETNDQEGALRAYDRAILLDDSNPHAYANRGTVRRRLKNIEGAIHDLDKAVLLAPKHAGIRIQRARAVWVQLKISKIPYRSDEWTPVLEDLNEAIRIAPDDPLTNGAYGRRAFLYRRLDKRLEAAADYDRAIELGARSEPNVGWIWQGQRGFFYFDEKRWKEARADFEAYMKLAPSTHLLYENVRRKLAHCRQEIEKRESR